MAQNDITKPVVKASINPIKALLLPSSVVSPVSMRVVESLSFLSWACIAMITTEPKQMTIATSSSAKIRSPSIAQARIEVQKGLVYQKTITSEMGAIAEAMLRSKKFACPVMQRQNRVHFFSEGKFLSGLI